MNFVIGSRLKIILSPNKTEIGLSGTIIRDLKNAFVILNDNENSTKKIKTILKKDRVFEIKTDKKVFIINGNSLMNPFYVRFKKRNKKSSSFIKKTKKKI